MARKKYDEDVKAYTPAQLRKAKLAAKDHFLKNNGEVSVKVLSRLAKVPQGHIREWMEKEKWEDQVDKIQLTPETQEALENGAAEYGLTDQEELFCYHYLKTFNATTSAMRAGYSSSYAHNKAYRLLQEDKIKNFLNYIKAQRNSELLIDSMRIVQEYIRIAFADMTDFVKFGPQGLALRPSNAVDGQLITKIKEGREGITIELADKMKALDKLEKLVGKDMDWKQKIEERKVQLMEQRLELDKARINGSGSEDEGESDDGLMEALKLTAKEVWADEEEE